jgi:two-component system, NarL family, sensor kinase
MDILSEQITLVVAFSAFFLLIAIGIVVLFLVYQKKQLQFILQKNELKNKYENELLNVQIEAREHTLNMVGLEIHDNVGQVLSLAKLNLNILPDPDQSENLRSTKELISKAIQDLRTISKTLNSNYIEKTMLSECFRFDLSMIQQSGVLNTSLQVEGEEITFNPEVKLVAYRMGQELLNNAIKHSEASQINLSLKFSPANFILVVEDNGKGIPSSDSYAAKGTGLNNLYLRARMIGGEFTMENARPGVRATLTISL